MRIKRFPATRFFIIKFDNSIDQNGRMNNKICIQKMEMNEILLKMKGFG